MKCPNCQKKFKGGVKCPNCDLDTVLYMGTVRLSDKLYNRGLERLKIGDFFHGIEALNKSVSINKNNVPSRNLLGLALFEMGHVGEALKHWAISQSMLKEENAATKYIESTHKNVRQLERLNDAVEMYNQALEHIKQKSDDLAIIQLKKAVEVNPRFVDALNLLTLCYLIQNERERAITASERVLAIDVFNPVALNYYAILNPGKPKPPKNENKQKTPQTNKNPYKPIGLEEKKQRNFHFAELLTFLIGVGCTMAAGWFLLYPAFENSREIDRVQAEQNLYDERIRFQGLLDESSVEKDELQSEIERVNAEMLRISMNLDEQQRINDINHYYHQFQNEEFRDNGELKAAVDALEEMNVSALPHDIQQRRQDILDGAYPILGERYYSRGLENYSGNDYFMALMNFEDAHRFLNAEDSRWNKLLFMLADIYNREERYDEAYELITELEERAAPAYSGFTGAERTKIEELIRALEARQ